MSPPRTVLITGAGSGIGAGLARLLAASPTTQPNRKHRLLLTDLKLNDAQQVAKQTSELGAESSAHTLNVADSTAVKALISDLSKQNVFVDVLINNAGVQYVAKVDEFPDDKWRILVDVMLSGVFNTTKACLPSMRARNFGRIINVGSIHSLVASPYKSAYVAAKHAIIGFAKTVALETGDVDVTINTLCPAYVRTPLVDQQIAAQALENKLTPEQVVSEIMLKPMPKKSFISIEELAGSVEFLMSPAARNISAQTIVIDGGWIAR